MEGKSAGPAVAQWPVGGRFSCAAQNLPCLLLISDLVSEREESQTDFYRTAEQEEATASLRVTREVEELERSGWATTRGVITGELWRRGKCSAQFYLKQTGKHYHLFLTALLVFFMFRWYYFSKNRPLADSFIESRCPSVCLCVPFPCNSPRGAKEVPGEQSQSALQRARPSPAIS